MSLAIVRNLYAGGSLTFKNQTRDQRVSENRQIGPIHKRENIGTEYGLTPSITNTHVSDRGTPSAFHHATVLIFECRNSDRTRSFHHRRSYGVGIGCRLDEHESARSTILWVRRPMPVFDAVIDLQHGLVAPRRIPCFGREEIPVALVAASPNHRINTRSAAQDLPHR